MTQLKTTNIKGKQYVEVNERLKYFREAKEFEGYSLETELVAVNADTALMRAVIRDPKGVTVATGTAFERKDNPTSMVNKTSHVENCETSAWGRALGNLGIGIDTSVASANELLNAQANATQPQPKQQTTRQATGMAHMPTQLAPKPAEPVQKPNADRAHSGTVIEITKLCHQTGTDLQQLYAHYHVVKSVPTTEQAASMLAALKKKLSKQLDEKATEQTAANPYGPDDGGFNYFLAAEGK